MQETILTNVIYFAPIGIFVLLLIMVPILAANLRQMKKINKRLTDTLKKADDYFQYILEDEEAEEEKIPEIRPVAEKSEKSSKKAEDAVLLQEVLTEYFS